MTLATAWAERRKVELTYTLPRTFTRVVWPLFLEPSLSGHALYLIAYEEKRKVARSYKLDRIDTARGLDVSFDPPLRFSVANMLAHSWGIWTNEDESPVEVELVFSPAVAARVKETVWHPSQKLEDVRDGGVWMRVLVSSLVEIRPWILSWGDDCHVAGPPALVSEVAAIARSMSAAYPSTLGKPALGAIRAHAATGA